MLCCAGPKIDGAVKNALLNKSVDILDRVDTLRAPLGVSDGIQHNALMTLSRLCAAAPLGYARVVSYDV